VINKTVSLSFPLVVALSTGGLAARQITDETGRHINVPEHPRRLISLAPSITETLFALGLADRLVGDTDYCDYPAEARLKPHVGALLNPSLEKIVSLKPDLILASAEANRRVTADQLERLGIPLYGLEAHTLEDALRSIDDLGRLLGCESVSHALVQSLQHRVEATQARVAHQPRPKVLFVVWYRPLITVGPNTFIADIVRQAGGVSVTDDLRGEWPRLSIEEVLRRDPDVILFPRAESFSPDLEEFHHLAGWKSCRAVRDGRLYFISATINRPSPRLVDALEEVARILHPIRGGRLGASDASSMESLERGSQKAGDESKGLLEFIR
jgi:iron complex transport system substrate-binding protein